MKHAGVSKVRRGVGVLPGDGVAVDGHFRQAREKEEG